MKKLFLLGLLMIMSVCCIFGQIDSKKLFLATNSFVTEESDDWKSIEPSCIKERENATLKYGEL